MEARLDYDFSTVRIHTDTRASQAAKAVGAAAYSVGNHLFFGAGRYQPLSETGRSLLAHELTHVKQVGGAVPGSGQLRIADPFGPAERIADEVGADINSLGPSQHGIKDPAPAAPGLYRKLECSIKHVVDECAGAAASCKAVTDCPSDIDAKVAETRTKIKEKAASMPQAAANLEHFLDNTGTERTMPSAIFATHPATLKQLQKHRARFLEGAKKRLEKGTLVPGAVSEEMVWTDTANAFSSFDDLAFAVGGYTLCSHVHVQVEKSGAGKFKVSFVDWSVQAFDCYNWDPGKGIGVAGFNDNDMCCIENAGRGKHFQIRTDEWKNTDAESTKDGEIEATIPEPADPTSGPKPAPGGSPDSPNPKSSPSFGERIRKAILGR